ncbi:MAG: Asp23/Gls24 family envelope stress response protein [Clostridia bacterium]|nr:Asp23/Gls24 family envelope stress response protein [Clostridia bacterium]
MSNRTELSVNTEVLAKMAEIAAKEIDGVAGLAKKAINLKGAVKTKTPFTGVKIESVNGALKLNVYICVKKDAFVKEVVEKVQENIKEKIQTMTGTAVTQVNVSVSDVELAEPEE